MRVSALNHPGPVRISALTSCYSQQLSVRSFINNNYYSNNTWTKPRGLDKTNSVNPFGAGAQALSYQRTGQNDPAQIGNQPGGGAAPALQENSLGILSPRAELLKRRDTLHL